MQDAEVTAFEGIVNLDVTAQRVKYPRKKKLPFYICHSASSKTREEELLRFGVDL